VLTDSQNSTKSGRFKEVLGSYDPRKSTDALDAERIKYWVSHGARPTDTVHNLLVKHKVINARKVNVSARSKKAPSSAEATAGKPISKVEKPIEEPKVEEGKALPETILTPEKDDITPTLAQGEVGAPTEVSE
jgi:small subunit ribosomal protein S16